MKNYLLVAIICLSASLASAQQPMSKEAMFPKTAKYYIKGGAEIAYDKIDSVMQAWGGRFAIEHSSEGGVEKIYLAKPDPEMMKKQREMAEKSNAMIGKPAAPFDLTDINGKKHSLASLKGKVVVLNFWFTACVPCKEEMPELNKLTAKYKGKDVVFLAIGLDNAEEIKGFLKTNAYDYTLLTDGKATAEAYQVAAYPTSMVIGKDGIVSYSQLGGNNIAVSLSNAIDKQL